GALGVHHPLAGKNCLADLFGQILVVEQELLRVLAALAETGGLVVKPRPALLDDVAEHGKVQEIAFIADAAIEHDVELGVAEGWRDLVLDHAGAGAGANGNFAFLDRLRAANVDADRAIELQRPTAGGGLGIAEHHANLFADLVDEDHGGFALGDRPGEL